MSEPTPRPAERMPDAQRHDAVPLSATTILERTLDGKTIDPKHRARAEAMARVLNTFLEPRYLNPRIHHILEKLPKNITEGETGEELTHITARIRERIRRAVHFFVASQDEWPDSPVVRMARAFDDVGVVTQDLFPQERQDIGSAIQQYIDTIIPLAFEQQWQDPPEFVSHDWSHSMRVAEDSIMIAERLGNDGFESSPLVVHMMQRYNINAGEVRLILYHINICHDCGYPHLKGREKSLHAIDSAELGMNDQFVDSLRTFIRTPNARLDILQKDMYEAIFYHGADVPQKRFDVRVRTNRGTFLVSADKLNDALCTLSNVSGTETHAPRSITSIEYAGGINDATKQSIRETAQANGYGAITTELIDEVYFIGRKIDLVNKGDELSGIEYIKADSNIQPLLALVRIADNMDLTKHRLGRVRHHPAYYEIIRHIGVQGAEHPLYKQLEHWDNKKYSDMAAIRTRIRETYAADVISDNELLALASAKDARNWLLSRVVNAVLQKPEYNTLPSAQTIDPSDHHTITRERIIETCHNMRSDVLEHQGGCLSIEKIELVSEGDRRYFKAYCNREKFDELRGIVFKEKGYTDDLRQVEYPVNVAEYQLWRFDQALRSNILRDHEGKEMKLRIVMVYADNGERILPPEETNFTQKDG